MNNERRKNLRKCMNDIEHIMNVISEIVEEEQDYMYNMPESLQNSERYEKAEEAVDNIESCLDSLNEACNYIESAIE